MVINKEKIATGSEYDRNMVFVDKVASLILTILKDNFDVFLNLKHPNRELVRPQTKDILAMFLNLLHELTQNQGLDSAFILLIRRLLHHGRLRARPHPWLPSMRRMIATN